MTVETLADIVFCLVILQILCASVFTIIIIAAIEKKKDE